MYASTSTSLRSVGSFDPTQTSPLNNSSFPTQPLISNSRDLSRQSLSRLSRNCSVNGDPSIETSKGIASKIFSGIKDFGTCAVGLVLFIMNRILEDDEPDYGTFAPETERKTENDFWEGTL